MRSSVEPPLQRGHARCDLGDVHVVIVADMRRRTDRHDAVLRRLARHRDAVANRARTIIQFGKYVTVQVDHPATGESCTIASGNGQKKPS